MMTITKCKSKKTSLYNTRKKVKENFSKLGKTS